MSFPQPGGGPPFQTEQGQHPFSPFPPFQPFNAGYPQPVREEADLRAADMNHPMGGQPSGGSQFDVFEWHRHYQSCTCYFLDHAQHSGPVQAVAAFLNIQLPFQKASCPIISSRPPGSPSPAAVASLGNHQGSSRAAGKLPIGVGPEPIAYATLVPYIRRLVATGFDAPGVLHGFFGDDWQVGIGPLHEAERRNYLFATKSDNWLRVKMSYDMEDGQAVPFIKPLLNVTEPEIVSAEDNWSHWLAAQDWMLGPRAPPADTRDGTDGSGGSGGTGGAGGHGHSQSDATTIAVKHEEEQ